VGIYAQGRLGKITCLSSTPPYVEQGLLSRRTTAILSSPRSASFPPIYLSSLLTFDDQVHRRDRGVITLSSRSSPTKEGMVANPSMPREATNLNPHLTPFMCEFWLQPSIPGVSANSATVQTTTPAGQGWWWRRMHGLFGRNVSLLLCRRCASLYSPVLLINKLTICHLQSFVIASSR
jgi:hypothetical protein